MVCKGIVTGCGVAAGACSPGSRRGGWAPEPAGFTLIELLVVMLIAGAAVALVAPKLFTTYEKIRAAAEEEKLRQVVETVKMRAFFRQQPYVIRLSGAKFEVFPAASGSPSAAAEQPRGTTLVFRFIRFPEKEVEVNGNGFITAVQSLSYRLRGRERALHVF
jgi:prepilin-type N-terminal cleavage/methylation domain-containing protein